MLATPVSSSARGVASLRPQLLLIFAALCWAGNFVLARGVSAQIPPVSLAVGRWTVAAVLLAPLVLPRMAESLAPMLAMRGRLLGLALLGIATSNTFVYIGLQTTAATHGVLLNALMPIMVALLAAIIWRKPLKAGVWAGMGVSVVGVMLIVTHGQPAQFATMDASLGDLWVIAGMLCWAGYTILLRNVAPQVDKLALLWVTIVIGLLMLTPAWLAELALRGLPRPDGRALAGVLYLGVFPSVLALIAYMRAVAEIGAARAAAFLHLIPAFGTLMAVAFLGERLALYHYVGLAAILGGLVWTQQASRYRSL
ncbi:DMT family transporter [Niveibacterium umoris]|uniref:Drug/metabolite transporter (DMT)-like permease n=1 Tax=Niveibacterium umoris TaxID=1193620 RepID=A0A840BJW5_9RHOO|nr:DMT family transporter [Niveibacterium umoris]MBB4012694.1 drug/metabolite transporter (DMT)-like permease [Niveibacterium umoris]